jgi:hypothetical protein
MVDNHAQEVALPTNALSLPQNLRISLPPICFDVGGYFSLESLMFGFTFQGQCFSHSRIPHELATNASEVFITWETSTSSSAAYLS